MDLPIVKKLGDTLGRVGMTNERKALALLVMGFFTTFFFLLVMQAKDNLPEWFPAFTAMFSIYVIAFLGVAANWFWGRWVAVGLGSWGATIAIWGMVSAREVVPALAFLGATHAFIAVMLMGKSMSVHYEGRADWRARFKLDEDGVTRLGKSVTRAASSVPALVLFALAPRQEGGAAILACAVVGLGALLLGRTISVFALALAAVGALGLAAFGAHGAMDTAGLMFIPLREMPELLGVYAGIALLAATAPFLGPIGRFPARALGAGEVALHRRGAEVPRHAHEIQPAQGGRTEQHLALQGDGRAQLHRDRILKVRDRRDEVAHVDIADDRLEREAGQSDQRTELPRGATPVAAARDARGRAQRAEQDQQRRDPRRAPERQQHAAARPQRFGFPQSDALALFGGAELLTEAEHAGRVLLNRRDEPIVGAGEGRKRTPGADGAHGPVEEADDREHDEQAWTSLLNRARSRRSGDLAACDRAHEARDYLQP